MDIWVVSNLGLLHSMLQVEEILCQAETLEMQEGKNVTLSIWAGRSINNLRYADDTTLMAESEEELKSLLMKVKEESEKVGLKQHSEN